MAKVEKEQLRREIRQRFHASSPTERQAWSEEICKRILEEPHTKTAQHILAFYPMKDEVNILPLIRKLRAMGKVVLMPEVISDEDMILREFIDEQGVEKGRLGTISPTGKPFSDYEKIDLVLVPGMAFTCRGERLGRGKGFYDRFLTKVSGGYKRGVCFPYQVVESIPCDKNDVLVDYV